VIWLESKFDSREAFFNGVKCWKSKDLIGARKWFQISLKDDNYKYSSLCRLVKIDFIEGNYGHARQLLDASKSFSDDTEISFLYGLLENIENNFELSKKHYGECMSNTDFQFKSLLAISKLYIQMGDYKIAQKMLETLAFNSDFSVQPTFGLISICILKHDFYQAQYYLRSLDFNKLTHKFQKHYIETDIFIKYFLGQLRSADYTFGDNYMLDRLFSHDDKVLIGHIKRHCNQNIRYSKGCFFENLDIRDLIYSARDIIEGINGNHFEMSDMYRFRLDRPIGYKGDDVTSDLCVVTMLGTKDIVTMYPVVLSDQFDKEGFSKNEDIRLKRLLGGMRK
jgi:hypothetical protein